MKEYPQKDVITLELGTWVFHCELRLSKFKIIYHWNWKRKMMLVTWYSVWGMCKTCTCNYSLFHLYWTHFVLSFCLSWSNFMICWSHYALILYHLNWTLDVLNMFSGSLKFNASDSSYLCTSTTGFVYHDNMMY